MIDFFRRLFFEDFWLLVAVAVPILIIALAIHRRKLTSRTRMGLMSTLGGFLLLFVLQFVVVTDREAIESTIRILARAVDEGDVPVIGEHLDGAFTAEHWNKSSFLEQINQTLQRWHVDDARVSSFKIEIADAGAWVAFRAFCDLRSDNNFQPNVISHWRVHCVRKDNKWKLDRIVSAKIGPIEANGYDIFDEIR